jgi:acetyl-CoA carboxylase carboxyl transferase subunit alpha
MGLAERRGLPLLVFVDTPAAEGRLEAEERGISESIAESMAIMSRLRTPIYVIVIGEGGSGGALAISVGDHIAMLEHAIYSIMPPEGCAAILDTFGRDGSRGFEAADALKLTAQDNLRLGLIDEVIAEPLGGAHRQPANTAQVIKQSILRVLPVLQQQPIEDLLAARYAKFRRIGQFTE